MSEADTPRHQAQHEAAGPTGPAAPVVTLREITRETVRRFCNVKTRDDQRRFVATVAESISEAYFSPEAWFRGICAGDEPVGFVMLAVDHEKSRFEVWRFLIGAEHQGRGHGSAAMRLIVEQVRAWGARELLLSYVPGEGEPEPFYRKLGFEPTGAMDGDEIVMRLGL